MENQTPLARLDKKQLKRKLADKMGLTCERHVFLCTGINCQPDGARTWRHLGKRLGELKAEGRVFHRTEVKCLKLCRSGPIALVLPEGTYYESVTPDVGEAIITRHLLVGEIVEEHAFAHVPPVPMQNNNGAGGT